MNDIGRKMGIVLAFVLAGLLAAGPALAEKPDWAGSGKHERKDSGPKSDKRDQREYRENHRKGGGDRDDQRGDRHARTEHRDGPRLGAYFTDRHRTLVREYYVQHYRGGHCPPGLTKKGNGCMPPGLAKKWRKGYALPRDVVYYDLPASIVIELGAPPALHRYVRVGTDILLIAIGTGLVVDAIEDLSGM